MTRRPSMCRSCGKLIGLEARCPWCGAPAPSGDRPRHIVTQRDHGYRVTAILTGVIVAIYAAALIVGGVESGGGVMSFLAPDSDFLMDIGLVSTPAVLHGEAWRLFTAIFLHFSLIHILFNASALWSVGRPFENDIGGAAFWTIFFLAGLAGYALGLVIEPSGGPPVRTGGASGSISGIIGAIIAWRRVTDGNFSHPLTAASIRFAVFTAAFGLMVPGINNVAHGGGFLMGVILGAAHAFMTARGMSPLPWRAGAVAGAAVAVWSVTSLATSGPRIGSNDVIRMDRCIQTISETLDRFEPGSSTALTTRLDPCIDDLSTFAVEPEAMARVEALRKSARAVHAALAGGHFREIEDASGDFIDARRQWRNWVMRNLDRFGLKLSP